MKTVFTIALVTALLVGCGRTSPNASVTAVESIAQRYNDSRSDDQILKDNALIEAVKAGDLDKTAELIAAGSDVNGSYIDFYADPFGGGGDTGYTPLLYAAIHNRVQAAELLIAGGADVNHRRKDRSALYYASKSDHADIVELLLRSGAEGDPRRIKLTYEMIRAACKGYQYEHGAPMYPGVVRDLDGALTVQDVVNRGGNVNWSGPNGFTPLMYAANLGLIENVRALLHHGADVHHTSDDGDTALSLASRTDTNLNAKDRPQIVTLLRTRLNTNE